MPEDNEKKKIKSLYKPNYCNIVLEEGVLYIDGKGEPLFEMEVQILYNGKIKNGLIEVDAKYTEEILDTVKVFFKNTIFHDGVKPRSIKCSYDK